MAETILGPFLKVILYQKVLTRNLIFFCRRANVIEEHQFLNSRRQRVNSGTGHSEMVDLFELYNDDDSSEQMTSSRSASDSSSISLDRRDTPHWAFLQ